MKIIHVVLIKAFLRRLWEVSWGVSGASRAVLKPSAVLGEGVLGCLEALCPEASIL